MKNPKNPKTVRPEVPQPAGASAVLGLGLATAEPHFTLLHAGEPALTLSSPSALFHVLLLFLQARPATPVQRQHMTPMCV